MRETPLAERRHWIFDMDGTLTVAVHDFEAIRAELELPAGRPILESLQDLPAELAEEKRRRLDRIERELARRAAAAPGAEELLAALAADGRRCGILTRNSRANALLTLRACGLADRFGQEDLISRDDGPLKPDPEGITRLLRRWGGPPGDAVMVGDFRLDLEAGRAAGVATVYVDPAGAFPWAEWADLRIRSLTEILDLLRPAG